MGEDLELLDRWRQGNSEAGNELFKRHLESLYRFFANKVGNDVEELIQNTLLGCVKGRDQFRGEASFRTYLFCIARNELYAYFRRRKRDDGLDFSVSSLVDLGPSATSLIAKNQRQRLLLDALTRIPLEQQLVVELFYWEHMTTAELAAFLEVPHGTAKSRLRLARESLRRAMVELAGDPTEAAGTLEELLGTPPERGD